MKKAPRFIFVLYTLLVVCGSLYGWGFAFEQRTVTVGGSAAWGGVPGRANVIEAAHIRPHRVLTLSASNNQPQRSASFDLSLSFNEGSPAFFRDSMNRYFVTVSPELEVLGRQFARAGEGAALFRGQAAAPNTGPLVIQPAGADALFSAGNRIRDFSIEFWLHPFNMANSEEILLWMSSRRVGSGVLDFAFQTVSAEVSRNRLVWTFANFFASPDGAGHIDVSFSGSAAIVPRSWSHHMIRFDAQTGMLEYLVNGQAEAVVFTTSTGREGGEVYTPIAGENGRFILGRSFMGIMDEFAVHNALADRSSFQRYMPSGGRVETQAFDLGFGNRGVIRVDVRGGRASAQTGGPASEFRENGRFLFADSSEMQFFIRSSDNQFFWEDSPWVSFTPGEALPPDPSLGRRFVQLAVDFFPSANGESSPFVEEMRLVYSPPQPPPAPRGLSAVAADGGVYLRWRPNPSSSGYLVFFGTESGVFFGEGSALGASPLDVGNASSVFIEGLPNGVLHFFKIAAYYHVYQDGVQTRHVGEPSREASARPLAGIPSAGIGF